MSGIVEEIFGHNLIVQRSNEKGEKIFVVIPISQEAEIIANYILPEGASGEELRSKFGVGEKEYNLGEKEISLEEIKVEDVVFICMNPKSDGTIEGIFVQIMPAGLFNQVRVSPKDIPLSVK